MGKLQDQKRQEFIDKILIPYGYIGNKGTASKFWVKTFTLEDGTKVRKRFVLNPLAVRAEKEIKYDPIKFEFDSPKSAWVRTKSAYYKDMIFTGGPTQDDPYLKYKIGGFRR